MGLRVKYGSKTKTEDTIRFGNMEVVGDFYEDVWGSCAGYYRSLVVMGGRSERVETGEGDRSKNCF